MLNEKKKQNFDFLKEQMEADLKVCQIFSLYRPQTAVLSRKRFEFKRREEAKTQQKLEDKAYMQSLINRDFELNKEQKEMEKELKYVVQSCRIGFLCS